MNNAVYLQSGGPTSVINSSFYGVILEYQKTDKIDALYGSKFGIEGLIKDDLIEIEKDKDYSFLTSLPGAILGSARIKLDQEDDYKKILHTIKKYSIKYIYVNGGNDSMDTAERLNKFFIKEKVDCIVEGIVKTIDNDLFESDFTPGFASAVNYINKTIMEISIDINSYKKGRVTIVEMMGRDTGWLCASSVISQEYGLGPDLIYVPEVNFSKDDFLRNVDRIYKKKGRVLVCVSEALKDSYGNYIFCDDNNLDSFGHKQLGSVSKNLCDLVKNFLHYSTRHIELNLMQRCAAHIHSDKDVEWATNCGAKAVSYSLEKKSGVVVIKSHNKKIEYQLVDFSKVANKVKMMPRSFINKDRNGITEIGKEYFDLFKDEKIKIDVPDKFKF